MGLAALALLLAASPEGAAQTARTATVTVPATITAEAASQAPLSISVGPASAVPPRSFVRLRGLPPLAALSEGHSIAPGAWAVALSALPSLEITLPAGTAGRSEVIVTLVGADGAVLHEAKSVLIVSPARQEPGPPPAASMLRASPQTPVPPVAAVPPAAVPAPVPVPARKALPPADRERAERLIGKGDEQMADGNVAAARVLYERAADIGLAQAAMALAATYDAGELGKLRVRGIEANAAEARRWYERARQLGAAEAEQRLQRLGAK